MTPEQYSALKALAAADPVAQAYVTDQGADDVALADWLNDANHEIYLVHIYPCRRCVRRDHMGQFDAYRCG